MNFGEAIEAMKQGETVARAGWNGKGMWLVLVNPLHWAVFGSGFSQKRILPWIGMSTADGGFVPWLASQTDMLSEDWRVVDDAG